MPPTKLILKSGLSPGDIVMLTAAVRDLHAAYPGEYLTDVRTPCPALWEHHPHLTKLADSDPETRVIEMHYPLIQRSNQAPFHFIHGYRMHLEQELGRLIPAGDFKGDLHLSAEERGWLSQVEEAEGPGTRFWIIVSGGKTDFTAKWWEAARFQEVVDRLRSRVRFVQVGEAGHRHPPLRDVLDLRGRTDLRQLVRLVHHADGVVCPVTSLMHLAAAVPTKSGALRPCVVIAGGREPSQWEAYPGHRYLDTIGALPCCRTGGCWKARVVPLGDGNEKDHPGQLCVRPVAAPSGQTIPQCLDLVSADAVVKAVESYLAMPVAEIRMPAPENPAPASESPLPVAEIPTPPLETCDQKSAISDQTNSLSLTKRRVREPNSRKGEGLVALSPGGAPETPLDHLSPFSFRTISTDSSERPPQPPPPSSRPDSKKPCRTCNGGHPTSAGRGMSAGWGKDDPRAWGPNLWVQLHARADLPGFDPATEPAWLERFRKVIPCPECRADFAAALEQSPPDLTTRDTYFTWTVELHNTVNRKLGHPVFPLAAAQSQRASETTKRTRRDLCKNCENLIPATHQTGPTCKLMDNNPLHHHLRDLTKACPAGKWSAAESSKRILTKDVLMKRDPSARVGLVIGTYGAVPYIHLQLESLRRFHPGTPCLVVDDGSPQREELAALCQRYGVDFFGRFQRMGHVPGDMQAFIEGLAWAQKKEVGLLVKLSRRWVPIAPWIDDAVAIWRDSGAPTLNGSCSFHNYGFRSECVAMDVEAWRKADALKVVREHIATCVNHPPDLNCGASGVLVEHIIHVAAKAAKDAARWRGDLNYAIWPWMGTSRTTPQPWVLWHEWARPDDYLIKLRSFGINYAAAQMIDPCGNIHGVAKRSRLLYIHQGLGDLLTNCGLILALQERWGGELLLPVLERNFATAEFLFADRPDIIPIALPKGYKGSWQFAGTDADEEVAIMRQRCIDHHLSTELSHDWQGGGGDFYCIGHTELPHYGLDRNSVDQAMYAQARVPAERRFSGFCLKRDREQETALFERIIGDDRPYIFVHDDPSRGYGIDVKSDMRIIRNDPSWPIHFLGLVLERAAELYCFDSSIRCLIEGPCFDVSKVRLFWSRTRGTLTHFTRHNWTFI